jgi:hypothetical protein
VAADFAQEDALGSVVEEADIVKIVGCHRRQSGSKGEEMSDFNPTAWPDQGGCITPLIRP